DLAEQTNVYEQHPEVVERLTQLMQQYIDQGRSTPGAPQQNEGETSLWGPAKK
ncbi:MAG: arylsulfatase, partial [Candidatus Hydrogenedentes bacterium]|nr:arylsulfatase [Candidatus Hydrogenedentota bacterium]